MAELSQQTRKLLDRLFNLKSEDNVIIKKIQETIEDTERTIENTKNEKSENEVHRNELEGKLTVFATQTESFKNAFEGIDDATFASLRDIGIEFEISKMLSTIAEKAPDYISSLKEQIATFREKIKANEQSLNELDNHLVSLRADEAQAEENRLKLISLLEQSLSNSEVEREVLTVNFVKKVLSLFDAFDATEIRELTKLIMFPDDGLFEFAATYEERKANGAIALEETPSVETREEQPEETPAATVVQEEPETVTEMPAEDNADKTDQLYSRETPGETGNQPVEITDIVGENQVEKNDLSMLNGTSQEESDRPEEQQANEETTTLPATEATETTEAETPEEQEEPVEESIEEYLEKIGLSIENFRKTNDATLAEIMAYLKEVDRKLIENNYELLRSLNVTDESLYKYRNNMLYIADENLVNKVTLLRSKGITDKIIEKYLKNPVGCFRITYQQLQDRIAAIESLYGSLSEETAYLLDYDIQTYEENLKILTGAGYELSPEESRNFSYLLTVTHTLPENIEILKNYLVGITRKNGKYAIDIFWKKPYELLTDIDDLIENDLESLIATNPEILARKIDAVLARIKYCEENGIAISEDSSGLTYYDYITDASKFTEKFGQVELPTMVNRKEINEYLPEIISSPSNASQVVRLFEILNEYYRNTTMFSKIELDGETKEKYDTMLQGFNDVLNAEVVGKNTYLINGIHVSKNKCERHLAVLLSALAESQETPENIGREILLTAALYNVRQEEETLQRVVSECLGFNEDNAYGGMKK